MKIAVFNQKGEKTSDLTLSKAFDNEISDKAVTLYVNYLRAALRSPIANAKDRSEVSGGGRKPWKQKGTGNARVGSSRSPLWVGGGVTFGPSSERNFRKRINANEKKRVILGIISSFFKDKKAIVIEDLKIGEAKTKRASQILDNIKVEGKVCIVYTSLDENASLSFRNINGVKPMKPNHLDMLYMLSSDQTVFSKEALSEIEKLYSGKKVLKSKEGKENE